MNIEKYNTEYISWIKELKTLIQKTQIKASLAVNSELIRLYWKIYFRKDKKK
jgi:hypothetical protein